MSTRRSWVVKPQMDKDACKYCDGWGFVSQGSRSVECEHCEGSGEATRERPGSGSVARPADARQSPGT